MKYAVIILMLIATSAFAVVQETAHTPLSLIRGPVAAADTPIVLTGDITGKGAFTDKPAGAVKIGSNDAGSSPVNGMISYAMAEGATGQDPNTASYTVTRYGWRKDNGPCEKLFSVAYTNGTQAVVKTPQGASVIHTCWAATATATSYALTATVVNSGNNLIVLIKADYEGYEWIYDEITAITAGHATNVRTYFASI